MTSRLATGAPGLPIPATDDRSLLAVQASLDRLRESVSGFPPFSGSGREVERTLVAGSNRLAHGLGRTPRGWLVLRCKGAANDLYESASDNNFLTLVTAGAPTVTLWVF